MNELLKLKQRRAELIKASRDLLDKAHGENRELTDEEKAEWDKRYKDIEALSTKIQREEQQLELERRAAEGGQNAGDDGNAGGDPNLRSDPGNARGGDAGNRETRYQASAFGSEEYRSAFRHVLLGTPSQMSEGERRALSAGLDTEGGFTRVPVQFARDFIKKIDDLLFIRALATVTTVEEAESLGIVSLENDPEDGDWTSELATGAEDQTMDFGNRELNPHPLAKRIKVSNKLIRASRFNIEAIVRDRFAYKFGVTEEKGFFTGDGQNKPLGVFVASPQGISTARDVSEGNTTTEIQFDGLIAAKFGLKGAYWGRARWAFHRDAMKQIAKLKDTNGQYLWRESVRVGEPDRILGLPNMMSEFVPNTFTTGQYVGILGDWSNYWIADALDMTVQRLVELYAEANQTGFIMRAELDAMPTLEEAWTRVQLA